MGKNVPSAAVGAQVRDASAAMQRQIGAGEKTTGLAPDAVPAIRYGATAPHPAVPPAGDDMRDADNDGDYGLKTSSMPGMPGPLPGDL